LIILFHYVKSVCVADIYIPAVCTSLVFHLYRLSRRTCLDCWRKILVQSSIPLFQKSWHLCLGTFLKRTSTWKTPFYGKKFAVKPIVLSILLPPLTLMKGIYVWEFINTHNPRGSGVRFHFIQINKNHVFNERIIFDYNCTQNFKH